MKFLPRDQVLTLEELGQIAAAFVTLGVGKIRLTGGEPLVRKNVLSLFRRIGRLGLRDFCLTTNGNQLAEYAAALKSAGVNRINISLDALDADLFKRLTRNGSLEQVLAGINVAKQAEFDGIKLNAVILKGRNDDQVLDLVEFARSQELDISFIEEMPLGVISEHNRETTFCSSDEVKAIIAQRYKLLPSTLTTGGPSRYWQLENSATRVGFISPHSHNFCGDCNRVRVTAEGRLLLCLGNEHSVDLKSVLRHYPGDQTRLQAVIAEALDIKPERHHFSLQDEPQIVRFMNSTGG